MLLIDTTAAEVIMITITSLIGICGVSAALEGYLLTKMQWYQRLLSLVGGLMLIFPGTTTDVAGLTLTALVVVIQLFSRRRAAVIAA